MGAAFQTSSPLFVVSLYCLNVQTKTIGKPTRRILNFSAIVRVRAVRTCIRKEEHYPSEDKMKKNCENEYTQHVKGSVLDVLMCTEKI